MGKEHVKTLKSWSNLISVYRRRGKYADAETALLELYAVVKDAYGESHERASEVRGSLAELYTEWNKPDRAVEYGLPLATSESELTHEELTGQED